ncbi:hypothetical protein [Anaerobium acetethylicum]|uniref:hypothetical protein n=1 Tax=Anaerobium acetethylicum TaxID=1619234 RepID=UPI000B810D3C|nr:hypothetical protein [Anaerobium acetethylicum]
MKTPLAPVESARGVFGGSFPKQKIWYEKEIKIQKNWIIVQMRLNEFMRYFHERGQDELLLYRQRKWIY